MGKYKEIFIENQNRKRVVDSLFYEKENGKMAFTEEAIDYVVELFQKDEDSLNEYEVLILEDIKKRLEKIE